MPTIEMAEEKKKKPRVYVTLKNPATGETKGFTVVDETIAGFIEKAKLITDSTDAPAAPAGRRRKSA